MDCSIFQWLKITEWPLHGHKSNKHNNINNSCVKPQTSKHRNDIDGADANLYCIDLQAKFKAGYIEISRLLS